MDGAAASIARSISIGASLLGMVFGLLVAMWPLSGAQARRDIAVSILAGIALLLIVLYAAAVMLVAFWGAAFIGLVKFALLLTAAFAVTGLALGLMRGMRSSRAMKPQSV